MAQDITLFALATSTQTDVIGNVASQPIERDTNIVGDAVDHADNRSCSVALAWDSSLGWDGVHGIADVGIETSENQIEWREIVRFKSRPTGDTMGSDRVSFTADRYVRGRMRVAPRNSGNAKGRVRLSVTGRAVGSAT